MAVTTTNFCAALKLMDGTVLKNTEFNNSNKDFLFTITHNSNEKRTFVSSYNYQSDFLKEREYRIYIATNFISYKMNSSLCKKYHGQEYALLEREDDNSMIYHLVLLSKEKWMKAPNELLQKINFTYNGKLTYFLTSSISSSGKYIWLTYDKVNKEWLTSELGSDTEEITQDNYGYLPVFVNTIYSDDEVSDYNTQTEIGFRMVAYDSDPNNGNLIYQPYDCAELHKDTSSSYNNKIGDKKNISFTYIDELCFKTYKVFINNELHYISKYPMLSKMTDANTIDLLSKLKPFTANGITYEIKLLSANQWEMLNPHLYDDRVDMLVERGTFQWNDGSEHETLTLAKASTSSYGYDNDEITERNYKRAYFGCAWNYENHSPKREISYSNQYSSFYPVIKRYNPDKEKNIEKFGTLQIVRSSNNSSNLYPQPLNSDCSTCTVSKKDTFTFVSTENDSLKWKWIKTNLGDKIIYISPVFLNGNIDKNTVVNNMKNVTINGILYKMRLLSTDEWKSLNQEVIKQIDFGICQNDAYSDDNDPEEHRRKTMACFRTITSTVYNTSDYEWFGGYDEIYYQSYLTGNTTEEVNTDLYPGHMKWGYLPVLELLNTPPTISGSNSNLGDKTQTFSVDYTVNDSDSKDTLTITEKLNNTVIRTINNAVRNQIYTFNITSSMFANLILYKTNTIEITVSDGKLSTTRTYTFRKSNTAPVINYTGSDNLGVINSKPTIKYTVTDAEDDEITITERLNGKVFNTYTVSSGTECTVNIPNMSWLSCGNTTNTIEINARDSAGGSSNKTITFIRAIDRIEVITNPIKTDKAVTKISLEIEWNTENASGQVYVSNNGFDESPHWEDMTNYVGSNFVYNITNDTKNSDNWGLSVKVIIKKDGGSTGEVSLYNIKGTYE